MNQQQRTADIQQAAIDAYLSQGHDVSTRLRLYGAALSFTGIADNGGLLGGGIENCRETDTPEVITDAVTAFRLFGLGDVADLVEGADAAYVRMRPEGASQELSEDAEALWDELGERWFALDVTARLDQIVSSIDEGL